MIPSSIEMIPSSIERPSVPEVVSSFEIPIIPPPDNITLIRSLKLPPKALIKLGSDYFKPNDEDSNRPVSTNSFEESHEDFYLESEERELAKSFHYDQTSEIYWKTKNVDLAVVENKCIICEENESDTVILECGHGGICNKCGKILVKVKGTCHICRREISKIVKIKNQSDEIFDVVGVYHKKYFF